MAGEQVKSRRTHPAPVAQASRPAEVPARAARRLRYATAKAPRRTRHRVVFLFDVDNTLLDNDRVIEDLRRYLDREVGRARAKCYWAIFEQLRAELGYVDYLGALQRYRDKYPREHRLLLVSHFLIDYPFAKRLFPGSLDAIQHAKRWGTTVILSDGDVVFQPRKVERSGLADAVEGNVLIYAHKEKQLSDVARRFPARHYVLVDDKLRILSAVKRSWGSRVTTVFVRQGHYALDPKEVSRYPTPDLTLARISDLLQADFRQAGPKPVGPERRSQPAEPG